MYIQVSIPHAHGNRIPWAELLLMTGFLSAMLVEEFLRFIHTATRCPTEIVKCNGEKKATNGVVCSSSPNSVTKNRLTNGFLTPVKEQLDELSLPENEPLVDVTLTEWHSGGGSNESQVGSPPLSLADEEP